MDYFNNSDEELNITFSSGPKMSIFNFWIPKY